MSIVLKPWQFNSIVCVTYFVFAILTMQVLKTLSVWPPAGVAVAGLLIFGRSAWVGVASGTVLSVTAYFLFNDLNPLTVQHLAIVLSTAMGNTLAAVVAHGIVKKRLEQSVFLTSVSGLANTFIIACIATGLISAIFGVGIYYVVGLKWFDGFLLGVLNWSLSNALAAIVLSPALYLLWQNWPHKFTQKNLVRFFLLATVVIAISYFVFGPHYAELSLPILQPALLLFPLLYAAIKLTPTATSCINVLVFFSAWVGSNQGVGYFYLHHTITAEVSMQFFFLFTLSAMLLVQAVFIQRKKEQRKLTTLLEQKVEERTRELERAKQEALALAVTDPLTQVYNRRGFFNAVNQQFAQYMRYPGSCALLLLDLDEFKAINDQNGHAAGDEVIRETAALLNQHSRESDIVGRIGGEEFLIFLPRTDASEALKLANRIREDLAQKAIVVENKQVRFTASFGVSALRAEDKNIECLIKRADKALYQAKDLGRNCAQAC